MRPRPCSAPRPHTRIRSPGSGSAIRPRAGGQPVRLRPLTGPAPARALWLSTGPRRAWGPRVRCPQPPPPVGLRPRTERQP
eukprot:3967521-Prymnesium_polylepis.2